MLSESARGPDIIQITKAYYCFSESPRSLITPYYAHPKFYKAGLHNTVEGLRNRERKLRIFFAGTQSVSAYSDNFRFPILSRDKIIAALLDRFKWAINSGHDIDQSKPMLIVLTDDTRDVLEKHKLSMHDYILTMSRSHFFVCPPGWVMPLSHNIVEAMSVGTIPITNYASYMKPPLTPGVNCLSFATIDELESVITHALNMREEEVHRLRENVISYYEQFLRPESFGREFMRRCGSISELVTVDG